MTHTPLDISPTGIQTAADHIASEYLHTPLLHGVQLADGAPALLLKDETTTPIQSFKGRGTEYYAARLGPETEVVVCASAGNFGQGLAKAMHRRGRKAVVFAAENANPLKLRRMQDLGGEILLKGADFDGANVAARAYAEANGLPFVEDAAHGEIAEGAGTLAKEMTDAGATFDAIYVPVGGGALINGIGTWIKHTRPDTLVIGVCAEGAPSHAKSWKEGKTVSTPAADTIADGIAIRDPVPAAVAHMQTVVDAFVTVSDADILAAMRALHAATGHMTEPSGAAGVAAILKDAATRGLKAPATVLCGANVTDAQKATWFA